jgi:hypothetical protein
VEESNMYSLWTLPAVALAVPVYAAWRLRQPGERKPLQSRPTVPEPLIELTTVPEAAGSQARVMQWISICEFLSILTKGSDLIVLDLRTNAQWDPFPIPTAFALPVTPNELDTVLKWLPGDRSVVFYGASNLSIFMIETSHCMDGSAPLYILEGDLSLAEVA